MYTSVCTYLGRALFKNTISELGIGMASYIFGMELIAVWKKVLHIIFQGLSILQEQGNVVMDEPGHGRDKAACINSSTTHIVVHTMPPRQAP